MFVVMNVSFFKKINHFLLLIFKGERERKEDLKDSEFPSFFQTSPENCDVCLGFFKLC